MCLFVWERLKGQDTKLTDGFGSTPNRGAFGDGASPCCGLSLQRDVTVPGFRPDGPLAPDASVSAVFENPKGGQMGSAWINKN